jgi:folate-binding protein YgfZ
MRTALEGISLQDTGIVRVHGTDAVKFLQGQLSNDVAKLNSQQSILAGFHNPQGRTIAVLRLVQWSADEVLAVLPRELAGVVAGRLAKYVLRAKAKVTDDSAAWQVVGLIDAGPAGGADSTTDLPITVGSQGRGGDTVFVRVGDAPPRWLAISPASPVLDYTPTDLATWQRLEVAGGHPQVYAATSEEFVAQMLNLDAVGGIAFDKGCYTGQEVIARAHYRGRVKRRMQRFVSRQPCQLAAGDSGQLADGRTFKVVLSAPLADGRCDFLAVASLAGGAGGAPSDGSIEAPSGTVVDAAQVDLPYPLPE